MTISGWILFAVIAIIIVVIGGAIFLGFMEYDSKIGMALTAVVTLVLVLATFSAVRWYYTNTETGKRAIVNQKSEFGGGLDRTINIYTADGEIIATYTGKIDIENKDGGYLLFDYEGKRYTYYNCFVESIADIE